MTIHSTSKQGNPFDLLFQIVDTPLISQLLGQPLHKPFSLQGEIDRTASFIQSQCKNNEEYLIISVIDLAYRKVEQGTTVKELCILEKFTLTPPFTMP